jgi:hypothetical protein
MQTAVADALRDKAMAKEYLLNADKYVKAGQFEKAREQIDKARASDPSNPYISAFEERIKFFASQKEKNKPEPPATPPPSKSAPPSVPKSEPEPLKSEPAPKPEPPPKPEPKLEPPPKPEPKLEPPPKPEPPPRAPKPAPPPITFPPPMEEIMPPLPPLEEVLAQTDPENTRPSAPPPPPTVRVIGRPDRITPPAPEPPAVKPPPPPREPAIQRPPTPPPRESDVVLRTQSVTVSTRPPLQPTETEPEVTDQIAEMRKQLQDLTHALLQERKAREEVQRQQLDATVRQFRAALEKAWQFGAPKAKDVDDLRRIAQSLDIPPNVESSVSREVKLAMYGRAVKEVIAKRKSLRSSSSTLEWLRKVYQISLSEYLEYESQFLMDLVSDQFRGTMLFVAADDILRSELVPRFKSSGFAVVIAPNPEGALEKVDKLSPNVIICDSTFGEGSLSGIKFLHIIRSNPKFGFVPFLLLCETSDSAQIPTTDLRPNEAVVSKPVDFDELSTIMNEKLTQLRHYISTL